MISLCLALSVCLSAADPQPLPDSYLLRVADAVTRSGHDWEAMQDPAAKAADRLIKGGKLWVGGDGPFASELTGRAGGLMLTAPLGDATPASGDVVLYSLAGGVVISDALKQSGALIIGFGDGPADGTVARFSGYATECSISPTLASIIPAWVFTATLVGHCVAQGKMPITYETIGLPGGYPRIQEYQAKGVFWKDYPKGDWVPGRYFALGNTYATKVDAILKRIESDERDALNKAGEWAAKTLAENKTVYMYAMGHSVPDELSRTDIGKKFKVATWNSGFAGGELPKDAFTSGDLAIHVGYQHPPNGLFERARPNGANIIYIDVLEHRDWKKDPHVLWIDPMWPWEDAVVSIDQYDIPMFPPSGIVNSAIAWEIYRLATAAK